MWTPRPVYVYPKDPSRPTGSSMRSRPHGWFGLNPVELEGRLLLDRLYAGIGAQRVERRGGEAADRITLQRARICSHLAAVLPPGASGYVE
jgi:hypothetical protein